MNAWDLREKLWGGIFGIVAIGAAILEMFVNGVSVTTMIVAVKDVASTLVVVVLFIAVIKHYMPSKINNFSEAFEKEMESIIKKYSPLIKKDEKTAGRYNMASKLSAIYNNDTGSYHLFFDFSVNTEIIFFVRKKIFMGESKESFEAMQNKIVSDISRNIEGKHEIVSRCSNTAEGFKVYFSKELVTEGDAKEVAEIVDKVMLLYIAEYKKS